MRLPTQSLIVGHECVDEQGHVSQGSFQHLIDHFFISGFETLEPVRRWMAENHIGCFARRQTVEYLREAKNGNQLSISGYLYAKRALLKLEAFICNVSSDEVILKSHADFALIDLHERKPIRPPREISQYLNAVDESCAGRDSA